MCKQVFYTKSESDELLDDKSDVGHTHEYVTTEQMNTAIENKLKTVFTGKVGTVVIEEGKLKVSNFNEEDFDDV